MTPMSQKNTPSGDGLIVTDLAMQEIVETISRISFTDSTILITGESGTGKSALARYIHQHSWRADQPFVTINCTTIPDNLIESELFGYVPGAFTSANAKGKPGLVKTADKGTLFFDEISLLPYQLQAKFLQLIQERNYTPVGSVEVESVDVRIIAATNQSLADLMIEHKFREDLYYRLRVIELDIPPLRKRPDAMDPLIDQFLDMYNRRYGFDRSITPSARNKLKAYRWKGNIRELQYVMERLVVTARGDVIDADEIPDLPNEPMEGVPDEEEQVNFEEAVAAYERQLLEKAFRRYGSSYKVADRLGLTQSKASRLLRKYGIR